MPESFINLKIIFFALIGILSALNWIQAEDESSESESFENVTTQAMYSLKLDRDESFLDSLELNEEEMEYLKSEPIIKIGVQLNREPFSFVDNSKYKGYFLDLLEDLFKGTGVKFDYVPLKMNQASVVNKIKQDEIDIATSLINIKSEFLKAGGVLDRVSDIIVYNKKRGKISKTQFHKMNLVVSRSNHILKSLQKYPSGTHPRYVALERYIFDRISSNVSEYTLTHMSTFNYFRERYKMGDELNYVRVSDLDSELPVITRKISYAYKQFGVLAGLIEKLQSKQSFQAIASLKKKWLTDYTYGLQNLSVDLLLNIEDLKFINAMKEVNVAVSTRNYPFEFERNNESVGFNIDVLKMFEESVGLKVNMIKTNYLRDQRKLFSEGNIHFLLFSNQSKLNSDSLKSRSVFRYEHNYVSRYDGRYISSVDQLFGKTVGIRTGWAVEAVNKFEKIKFKDSYSYKEILSNVSNGLFDAAIVPSWALSRSIAMDGIHNLNINGKAIEFEGDRQTILNFHVSPDFPELNAVLNKFLNEFEKKFRDELIVKWFGQFDSAAMSSVTNKMYRQNDFPNLPGLVNNELKYLRDLNELKVGISPSWMPFGHFSKGGQDGLVVDVLKQIGKSMNKEVAFVHAKSRAEAYQLLKENRIDIYCLGLEDSRRMSEVNYSEAIGTYKFGLVVRDGTGKATLQKLEGKKIGVIEAMPYAIKLQERFPAFNYVNIPNAQVGFQKVRARVIDAYVDLDPVINYHLRRKSVPNVAYGMQLPLDQNVSFVTNKNAAPELLSIINKAIKIIPNSERALMNDKWYSVKIEKVTDYTTLYMALGFTAVLTIVFIYWNGKLTRLNQIIKEKESLSRSLLESTNAVPYNYDLTKQAFTYVAPQITKVTGYLPTEFEHIEAWALRVHPEDREKVFEKRNQSIEQGKDFVLEYRFKRKNDVYIWVKDLVSVVVERQHTIALRGLIMNITNEKNQAIAIKAAKDAAESANQSKSQFLANMSHEIRTPLNPIIGLTHLALKANPSEQIRDYLNKVELSSKSLLRIINDILDFSKMEANKLNLEKVPFDIEQLNERINSLYGVKAAEKNLELEFKKVNLVYPYVLGDPLRLEQVLGNLVSNAIKFTDSGKVTVSVECLGEADTTETLCFMVEDTGVGIPKNKLKKVFELFTQADDSNTRTHGGTGLGLNICTRLVEMMGGKLEASSEEGKGSKFYFSIPFTRVTQEQVESHTDPALNKNSIPKFEKRKVLLVEDNKINKQVAEELLKAVNLEVTHVSNGQECINIVSQEKFDVVLMDVQMPVMDGFEATRILRKDPRFAELPIVAMTAHAFASEKEQTKKVGMSAHVTKPVDPVTLYNTLMKYIPVMKMVQDADQQGDGVNTYSVEKILNTNAGINRLMGNRDLYYNILIDFKNNYVDLLGELEGDLKYKDKSKVQKVLHQLKGAAGNVGAELLFDCTQQFETVIKQSKDYSEEYEVFKEILNQTFERIDEVMEKFQMESLHVTVNVASSEEIESVLNSLMQQVSNASPDSLSTAEQLQSMLGEDWKNEVIPIKVSLQNFDFYKAAEQVSELQKAISAEVS